MNHLEPNAIALTWFVPLWGLCCLAFFQLAGMYPLPIHGDENAPGARLLVLGNSVVWLVLSAATIVFAYAELRWTTIVVVAGLLFLFIPGLFQAIPPRLRDGRSGLAVSGGVMVAALAALVSHA